MGNRSCINISGNATQGQSVGIGCDVYKGKSNAVTLQFKSLSVTGSTMSITCDDDNIYFSASSTGGGGSPAGSDNQIQFNDNGSFGASADLCWDGGTMLVKSAGGSIVKIQGDGTGSAGITLNQGGSISHNISQSSSSDSWLNMIAGGSNARIWIYTTSTDGTGQVVIGNQGGSNTWLHVRDRSTSSPNTSTMLVSDSDGNATLQVRETGAVHMPQLPVCTSETNQVYINSVGQLSSGATSGGGSSYTFTSGLTESSNVVCLGGSFSNVLLSATTGTFKVQMECDAGSSWCYHPFITVKDCVEMQQFICYPSNTDACSGIKFSYNGNIPQICFYSNYSGNNYMMCSYNGTFFEMAADYSGNWGSRARAIIDKGYVDNAVSDCRLKTCVQSISAATSSALSIISGFTYQLNELASCPNYCGYGFYADDVQQLFPFAVKDDAREINGVCYKGIDYKQMIPVLWNIVKEQEERIKALEDQINA